MPIRLLLVSGSFRQSSTNTAVLRTAAAISPPDVEAEFYAQADRLLHFNPMTTWRARPRKRSPGSACSWTPPTRS